MGNLLEELVFSIPELAFGVHSIMLQY